MIDFIERVYETRRRARIKDIQTKKYTAQEQEKKSQTTITEFKKFKKTLDKRRLPQVMKSCSVSDI